MADAARTFSNQEGIQVLRGFAAIAVVLHHILSYPNPATPQISPDWFTKATASGVDVFFVISGFIMLYTSFRPGAEPARPVDFLKRRFARIYPLYWLCCLPFLALKSMGFFSKQVQTSGDILTSLLLIPTVMDRMVLGVAWTLIFEIWFYILFAIGLLGRKPALTTAMTAAAIGTGMAVAPLVPSAIWHAHLANPIMAEFIAGLALGLVYRCGWIKGPSAFAVLAIGLGLLGIAAGGQHLPPETEQADGHGGLLRALYWGLPATLIVAAGLRLPVSQGRVGRFLVLVGDASYAIYLTHLLVTDAYALALRKAFVAHIPQLIILPAVAGAALALGLVAHLWVERPLNRWIKRKWLR
jgi:exopolysaccharide production protein ExoZ